ncbi:MAG: hypothetical protein ACTSP0_07520 [Alphaproteobacteria bacterium]
MKKSLYLKVGKIVLGLGLLLAIALPVAAQDTKTKKKPNDRTVRVIMSWAFAALPEKFKFADGKEITIDRGDPKKFYIPVDDARRIIRVAMRSSNADLCGLQKLQVGNFRKMMNIEKALGKWSRNQLIFIKQLHIATGLVVTGKFVAGKEAESNQDRSDDRRNKDNCSDKERARVTASIETYLAQSVKTQ